MATKKILGLDLGTNSIGWAMVETDEQNQPQKILKAGSRIIPMDAKLMGDFESGNSISQTGERTRSRGVRRLYERRALRRERLCRVLNILGALPEHYACHLNRYGQLNKGKEPKLAWNNGKFLFMDAFNEMCNEFRANCPDLFTDDKTIAYDWTIYYLRKKALTQPISKQELAWILMQFNQKRGYNQARGEEEEQKPTEKKEFYSLVVKEVRDTGEVAKGKTWYEVVLENGWIYKRQSATLLDWVGKTKEFIVTTKLNEDGTEKMDKEGNVMRSFRAPNDDDWGLKKLKAEHDIELSHKTIGEYIYDALMQQDGQKVIGQLVRVVDRKFYREELHRIVRKQMEFIPELRDTALYQECLQALYTSNENYRNSIAKRDFEYLLIENILFYQRPLRSKKSLISECPYEYQIYKDKNGKYQRQYLKCISKSHPLYEEFRVLQFVSNLRIYKTENMRREDCTTQYIPDKELLVKSLMSCKAIDEKGLLKLLAKKATAGLSWNYVPDKEYPLAPVTATISKTLADNRGEVTQEHIEEIWHILYSVLDKQELLQALSHYAARHQLTEGFVEKLGKQKPFEADYGGYSLRAIKKLLSLMRFGTNWCIDAIDKQTKERIEHIITGEYDKNITDRVREKCVSKEKIEDFQGLELWLAEYVVYGVRDHSTKWNSPHDIDDYIQHFRLHSLNNPIVEQVVMETLRMVRDIWQQYGSIDEIHLEMGREMKKTSAQRKNILQKAVDNEKTNLRIKRLLMDFMNPDMDIEGVRSYSPSQQELFRIFEDGVLQNNTIPEDIQAIINELSSAKQPTHAEIRKYRLWLEQKYISPYTGEIIPLSKLFTPAYEIEHVIPQSLFFDDSWSNKVICEAEVNHLKTNQLAHDFITHHGGEKVMLTGGKVVEVLNREAYESLIKQLYSKDSKKLDKLMRDEIPNEFSNRQATDSSYISRLMKGLLSNIVREQDPITHEYEMEETSKNMIVTSGTITDRLKKDWGVNDVWNHIILPRFVRLNQLQDTDVFTSHNAQGHLIPRLPMEVRINKKRIDHRHHAMDAIVIACVTRNHVNLLNNLYSDSENKENRYALNHLLREKIVQNYNGKNHTVFGYFLKPWDTFTQDVETTLQEIVVSFKQNLRVINKSNNHYMHFVDGKKKLVPQTKGDNWSIRKSLHKETVFGLVNLQMQTTKNLQYALAHLDDIVEPDLRKQLRELVQAGKNEKQIKQYFASEKDTWADINLQKIAVYYYTNDTNDRYYAVRTTLDDSFTAEMIDKITDSGIRAILRRHLKENGGNPTIAFSADGIENMNRDIVRLNNGKLHKPILKVRKYEKADKFAIGQVGVKSKKFVEADKGTNLFFAVYAKQGEDGKEVRSYVSVPFKAAVDCQKEGEKNWRQTLDKWIHSENLVAKDCQLKFILSPGDLVYVPTSEEIEQNTIALHKDRIYKVVSFTGSRLYIIPSVVASVILDKIEYTQLNKMEFVDKMSVKSICIPIKVDRLGNIL